MSIKKKNFMNAHQYVKDMRNLKRYEQVRKFANSNVLNIDTKTLAELTVLLRGFVTIVERVKLAPGANVNAIIRQQLEKLPGLIQSMISIWGIEEFIRRCEHAIKIDMHRPRNMPILDLVADPDLFYLGGDFSTFDKNLAKKQIANRSVEQIKEYIIANIPTADAHAQEVANAALKVLEKNAEQQKYLIFDNDTILYSLCFQKIADDMMDEMNLPGDAPWVSFVESWDFLENAPKNLLGMSGRTKPDSFGNRTPYIIHNLNKLREWSATKHSDMWQALTTLWHANASFAHEFVHFIDNEHPNRGALGAQKAHLCNKIYNGDESEHSKNPTEKVPLMTGNIVEQEIIKHALNLR